MADIPKDLKPGYYTLSTDKAVYDQAVNMNSQQLESWLENNEHFKSEYSEKILDAMKASEKPVTKEKLSPEAAAKKVGGSYWGFFDETKRRGTNLAKTLQGYKYGGEYSLQVSKEDAIKQMEKLYEPGLWERHYGVKEKEDIREKVDEAWDVVNVPKGTIEFDPNAITKAGMFPSFEDLQKGWENLTKADPLSEFDITSTMGVETPETPSGLSTDVFAPPAYETFAPDTDYSALGKDYEEIAADELAFAADPTFETSEEQEEYNEYLSQIAGMPKIKRGLPSFKNMRGIISAAYAGGKKTFPMALAYDAAQGMNFQNLRGGLTQRGYEQERQNRINERSRRNIMQTLQSGKYAPGFKEAAFQRVQDLTKNLNLVDAADVGLTTVRKPPVTVSYDPVHHPSRGDGGGHATPASMGMSTVGGGDPFYEGGRVGFSKGGIVDLWQELSNL